MEVVPWQPFFDEALDKELLHLPGSSFRIYSSRPQDQVQGGPLFVLHHGGGYTGLSFAVAAQALRTLVPSAHILSFDCRGHGQTRLGEGQAEDELSVGTLAQDLVSVVKTCYPSSLPSEIILVGHSMGGSIVVHVAAQKMLSVRGVAVLDVVEGTAIESLPFMDKILRSRPASFKSHDAGVKWALRSGMVKNKAAAQVSLPSQLIERIDATGAQEFVWRTDLKRSQPHWEDWFTGLSEKFLSMPCGRLLVLAGTERLDKPMMIGQMQGKFQMVIFPESGHVIQEDAPDKLAESLVDFWKRNQPLVIKKFPIPLKKG